MSLDEAALLQNVKSIYNENIALKEWFQTKFKRDEAENDEVKNPDNVIEYGIWIDGRDDSKLAYQRQTQEDYIEFVYDDETGEKVATIVGEETSNDKKTRAKRGKKTSPLVWYEVFKDKYDDVDDLYSKISDECKKNEELVIYRRNNSQGVEPVRWETAKTLKFFYSVEDSGSDSVNSTEYWLADVIMDNFLFWWADLVGCATWFDRPGSSEKKMFLFSQTIYRNLNYYAPSTDHAQEFDGDKKQIPSYGLQTLIDNKFPLFDYKTWLLPCSNNNHHWLLKVEFKEDQKTKITKYDSLGGARLDQEEKDACNRLIKSYWAKLDEKGLAPAEATEDEVATVSKQENLMDCGPFTCLHAALIMSGQESQISKGFNYDDIKKMRNMILCAFYQAGIDTRTTEIDQDHLKIKVPEVIDID